MLTITSNFSNYKDRQGEHYTVEDLDKLCKNVITCDIINFKDHGKTGYGFTANIAKQIMKKITVDKDSKVLIINDLSLHMLNELLDAGFKLENIYMAYGKWDKKGMSDEENKIAYDIMVDYIKANFKEKINVIKLKEIFNMKGTKINLIIANPPYGAIGANITDHIRKYIDFDEYINLLPANDYKRNKTKDLFNYQSDMESLNNGFEDAAVTTHVARIHDHKVNNLTLDEFERSQYIDRSLDKYFLENSKRKATYSYTTNTPMTVIKNIDIKKTIILGAKDVNHKHLPFSKDGVQFRWNIKGDINADWVSDNYACKNSGKENQTSLFVIYLNSNIEKEHIASLLYDKNGFRFFSKLWTSINVDSYCMPDKYLPKVDWAREWTVEEILENYGYTKAEIKEVMDDLDKYKGMED